MIDDRALVSRVISGDKPAFRFLIDHHARLVAHMVARVVKGNEDREEICQDVFLKVFDSLPGFGFQSKLSTWIATIAYRHAINHVRKQRMDFDELREGEEWNEKFIERIDPEEILSTRNQNDFVLEMIEQLPPQYKIVLTLYHLEGMNYSEIESVTKMPAGTVKNYLFRARTLLKEKVKRYLDEEMI